MCKAIEFMSHKCLESLRVPKTIKTDFPLKQTPVKASKTDLKLNSHATTRYVTPLPNKQEIDRRRIEGAGLTSIRAGSGLISVLGPVI